MTTNASSTINNRERLPKTRLLVIGEGNAPSIYEHQQSQPLSQSNPLRFDIVDSPSGNTVLELYQLVTDPKCMNYLQVYLQLLVDLVDTIVYVFPDGSLSQAKGACSQMKGWFRMISSLSEARVVFVSYQKSFHRQASLLDQLKECFLKDSELLESVIFPSRLPGDTNCLQKIAEVAEAGGGVSLTNYLREVTPMGWVKRMIFRAKNNPVLPVSVTEQTSVI